MYLYLVKRRWRHNTYYYYYSQTIVTQNRRNSSLQHIIINLDAIAATATTAVIRGTQTNRVFCADNGEIE